LIHITHSNSPHSKVNVSVNSCGDRTEPASRHDQLRRASRLSQEPRS
jgi:hypothetical protein